MNKFSRLSILAVGGALSLTSNLEARPCTGNGDAIGAYGWSGSRSPIFVSVAVDRPSTTSPIARSTTPIGALAGGAANTAEFAAVGRVFLDGSGAIFASPTASAPILQVGTYSINVDCTLSAKITDAFMPIQEFAFGPSQASATFQGVLVQSGAEIDLVQTSGIGGMTLTLRKMKQYGGCGDDALNTTFGLSATGQAYSLALDNTQIVTPFILTGRIAGDGAGKFVIDALAEDALLTDRQFTGSYSVSADCTGTGTLVDSKGKNRKISFVLVNSGVSTTGGSGVLFAFTDTSIGSGQASQQ